MFGPIKTIINIERFCLEKNNRQQRTDFVLACASFYPPHCLDILILAFIFCHRPEYVMDLVQKKWSLIKNRFDPKETIMNPEEIFANKGWIRSKRNSR